MMDEQLTLFKSVQETLGWPVALCVMAGLSILAIFSKNLAGVLGKRLQDPVLWKKLFRLRKADITRHPIFSKYRFLINQRLKYLRCHCVLRKRIFCDLMMVRISVSDRIIREFVEHEKLNRLSMAEFQYAANEFLFRIFTEWEENAYRQGIPPIVVARFLESTRDIRRSLVAFVQSVSNSSYSYEDNYSRLSAILDMLSGLEEAILMKLEESLDTMNGEISGTSYKGIQCMNCETCQSRHR